MTPNARPNSLPPTTCPACGAPILIGPDDMGLITFSCHQKIRLSGGKVFTIIPHGCTGVNYDSAVALRAERDALQAERDAAVNALKSANDENEKLIIRDAQWAVKWMDAVDSRDKPVAELIQLRAQLAAVTAERDAAVAFNLRMVNKLRIETDKRPIALPGSPYLLDELLEQFYRTERERDTLRAELAALRSAPAQGWRLLSDDELNAIEERSKRIPLIGPLVVALRGEELWNDKGDEISGEDAAYLFCDIACDDVPRLIADLRRLPAARTSEREEVVQKENEK